MRAMRNSGVPWIGEVPAGWEVRRVKSIATFSRGLNILKTDLVDDVGAACVSYGEAHGRLKFSFDAESDYIRKAPPQFTKGNECSLVRQGDFIFADTSEDIEGSGDFTCNFGTEPVYAGYHSHIVRLRDKDAIDYRFLAYAFESQPFRVQIQQIVSGVKVYTISVKTIGNAEVLLPPLPEQRRIAGWLDERCADIDAAVEAARASIDEYEAYKKSVISHAVTRGLDPDVPLKDTGIPWLGQIPAGWEVKSLKYLCSIATGDSDTQDADPEGEFPFYVRSPIVHRSKTYTFEGEGILMAGDGAGAGRVFHYAKGKYAVHQRVYRIADIKGIDALYLYRYLASVFPNVMDQGSAQSTVPSVRLPMLKTLPIPIPPLPEQRAIAAYLDARTAAIDAVVAQKRVIVEDLLAYKKSLIYEAVTGKREV